MSAIKAFIRNHPVLTYFTLTFAISWGGILLVIAPHGIIGAENNKHLFGYVFLAMCAGPSLSSLLLTGIVDGKDGYRSLLSRLTRWRVNLCWYAAVLIPPALLGIILGLLTLESAVFTPGIIASSNKIDILVFALIGGLCAGFFEELGWTGFLIPRLLKRYSIFVVGLGFGIIWTAWHFLADIWGTYRVFQSLYVPHFLSWLIALPAYRILMVWVFAHSQSLLLAVLMHASFTGGQALFWPSTTSAAQSLLWYGIFAVALWGVVGIVALTSRGRFTNNLKND